MPVAVSFCSENWPFIFKVLFTKCTFIWCSFYKQSTSQRCHQSDLPISRVLEKIETPKFGVHSIKLQRTPHCLSHSTICNPWLTCSSWGSLRDHLCPFWPGQRSPRPGGRWQQGAHSVSEGTRRNVGAGLHCHPKEPTMDINHSWPRHNQASSACPF